MWVPSKRPILEQKVANGLEFDEVGIERIADPDEAVFAQEEFFAEDQEG